MKKNSLIIILGIILIFGFLVRVINLSSYPPGLNWDEVSLGYNAYSLLHTGRDEWNKVFPTTFRAYGDYKLPLYIYASVPSIAIFGLTPLGVRLPSVISGTGLILVSFMLALRLLKNKQVALLTSFLVATQPWTVFLSRVAVEANLATFFITLGLYLGLSKRYWFSALFLGLSVWTYNSARFFVPAVILISLIYLRHKLNKIFLPLLLAALLIVPMLIQLLQPSGQARLGWLTLLDSGALAQIGASRAGSHFPFPRLLYNKLTYFIVHFSQNYISYLSPDFLFIKGGSHYQFNIPHQGLLAPVCGIFFYLGLIYILLSKNPTSKIILIWLLLAPIAGSITRDSPHTLRAITMLPLPMLFSAYGFIKLQNLLRFIKIPVTLLFFFGVLYSFWSFSSAYTSTYTRDYSWSWQYGYSQVISYINSNYTLYDEIIFTKKYGEPHEFVLFYTPWEPEKFLTDSKLIRYWRSDWYWVDGFAKYHFVNDWEMPTYVKSLTVPGKYLIISGPDNPVSADVLYRVNFLDQKPAFTISQKII